MSRRLRAALEALALGVLVGLLVWQATAWHVGGEHEELFKHIDVTAWDTTKAALYNLGLMLATGTALGLLLIRVTDVFGYRVRAIDHFRAGKDDREGKAG